MCSIKLNNLNIMRQAFIIVFIIFFIFASISCTHIPKNNFIHYSIQSKSTFESIHQALLFPMSITVVERFPGGVTEEIPEWSEIASQNLESEVLRMFNVDLNITTNQLEPSKITPQIENHIKLYDAISHSIKNHTLGIDTWQHKTEKFDYTIGDGLKLFKEEGIDAVIIGSGLLSVSMKNPNSKNNNIIELPQSEIEYEALNISLSLVDIETGNIIWTRTGTVKGINLKMQVALYDDLLLELNNRTIVKTQ